MGEQGPASSLVDGERQWSLGQPREDGPRDTRWGRGVDGKRSGQVAQNFMNVQGLRVNGKWEGSLNSTQFGGLGRSQESRGVACAEFRPDDRS